MNQSILEDIDNKYHDIITTRRERMRLSVSSEERQVINYEHVLAKASLFIEYIDYPEELSELFRNINSCYKENWTDHIACPRLINGCTSCAEEQYLYNNLIYCINNTPKKPIGLRG